MINISISAQDGKQCDEVLDVLQKSHIGHTLVFDVDVNEGEVAYDVRVFPLEISFEELTDAIRWGCDYVTEDDLLDMVLDSWKIERIQTLIWERIAESQS